MEEEEASESVKAGDDSRKEKKRNKKKEKGEDGSASESKDKKEKKKDKESKKRKSASPPESAPADSQTPTAPQASDPSLDPSQNNLTISRLGVFEYLSNRLIVRKAAVQRAQKQKQGTVWDRVAAISA